MAINYEKLKNREFPVVEQSYTERDTIIYALGVGYGFEPLDKRQLDFAFEESPSFKAAPTMAAVLATPGFWAREPDTGLDWKKILHGEQGIVLHRPLPTSATVTAQTKILEILDKGDGKGALIYQSRDVVDKATGEKLATLTSTTFARGDGGFGGPSGPQPQPQPIPDRPADKVCDLPTADSAALLYRLSGDPNPLHIDPDVATSAGFKAPILHGLCTLGVAGHAVLREYCDYDTSKFRSLKLRFSSPVYPGETIRTEMWREGDLVSFRSSVVERGVVVLNNGCVELG